MFTLKDHISLHRPRNFCFAANMESKSSYVRLLLQLKHSTKNIPKVLKFIICASRWFKLLFNLSIY
jgi:hypothetical protein